MLYEWKADWKFCDNEFGDQLVKQKKLSAFNRSFSLSEQPRIMRES